MSTIRDKEFLTFCNATNLDWQFSNTVKKTYSIVDKDGKKKEINEYFKLHELLSPEKFERKYDDGRTEDVYKDISQMQAKAGILMNYLEECGKGSGEGNFLKEWEVVYGADSYKLLVDELFIKTSKKLKIKDLEYPTRDDVASTKKTVFYIDVVISLISNTVSIVSGKDSITDAIKFKAAQEVKKELLNHVGEEVKKAITDENELLKYIALLADPGSDVRDKLVDGTQEVMKCGNEWIKKTKEKDIPTQLKLTRKVNFLANDKFKVVIFKRGTGVGTEIVVAIDDKGLEDGEVLPENIDLLQLLCTKIEEEFKEGTVYFTGYDKGATLGILCNLLRGSSKNSRYFFTNKAISIFDYVDYTQKDQNKKYQGAYEIFKGKAGEGFKELGIGAAFLLFASAPGVITLGTVIALKNLISATFDILKTISHEKKYELLKQYKFITENVSPKIKGYITDDLYNNEYMPIMTKTGYINIKNSHALFLVFASQDDNWSQLEIYPDIAFLPSSEVVIRGRKNKGVVEYFAKYKKESDLYFRLILGANKYYEIVEFVKIKINESIDYGLKLDDKFLFFNTGVMEKLRDAEYAIATMKVTGRLQRAYKKIGYTNFPSYVMKKEKIEKTSSLTGIIPLKSSYIFEDQLNEHIFLPYITKDGNIGQELRKEYIKQVFKDSTKEVFKVKKYNDSYLKSKEPHAVLYQVMKDYDDIKTIQNQSLRPYYYFNTICEKKDIYFKEFIKVSKFNDNENKAVVEMLPEEMKYAYNPKVLMTREPVDFFVPIDTRKNSKFEDIANVILPPITINDSGKNKNNMVWCDTKALDYHLKADGKTNEQFIRGAGGPDLVYRETIENGKVHKQIKANTYKQNYSSKTENGFRQWVKEDDVYKEHEGVDFSYGRMNPICCSHPRVYSPVNGVVTYCKNGKISIVNTENKKDYFGKEVEVPYYHIIEHMHEVLVDSKDKVRKGQAIGTMGGRDTSNGAPYKYLQHVHYEIRVCNRYYTGNIKIGINPKNMKKEKLAELKKSKDGDNRERVIDPLDFWEKGIEDGILYPNEKEKVGGQK